MSDVATNAELEALRKAAGIPYLPTQLTFEARLAISGEGPRAYDWSDKSHRIVYDLCREIEKNAALLAMQLKPTMQDEAEEQLRWIAATAHVSETPKSEHVPGVMLTPDKGDA